MITLCTFPVDEWSFIVWSWLEYHRKFVDLTGSRLEVHCWFWRVILQVSMSHSDSRLEANWLMVEGVFLQVCGSHRFTTWSSLFGFGILNISAQWILFIHSLMRWCYNGWCIITSLWISQIHNLKSIAWFCKSNTAYLCESYRFTIWGALFDGGWSIIAGLCISDSRLEVHCLVLQGIKMCMDLGLNCIV